MATAVTVVLLVLHLTITDIMGDCPYKDCTCYDEYINCQDRGFDKIPPVIPGSVNTYPVLRIWNNRITIIPDNAFPAGLTEIDLSNNPLTDISPGAFINSAPTLQALSLTSTHLTELPDALLNLTQLTSLTINDSPVQIWKRSVLEHIGSTLRELTLNNVGLKSWPVWLRYFPFLTVLSLSDNLLSPVPDTAFDLLTSSLHRLTMVSANLTSIPRALTVLSNLTSLDLSKNNITEVENLPTLSPLQSLSLGFNNISNVYKLVYEISPYAASLNYLYLHVNRLKIIPHLSHMTALLVVMLDQNQISDPTSGLLPPGVFGLQLGDNNLQRIPSVVKQLPKLLNLFLHGNSIQEIRANDLPAQLSHLDIRNNLIQALHDNTFPTNSSLRTLYISGNPITNVSNSAFKSLSRLNSLAMGKTSLTRVPTALSNLANLNGLDLSQNPHLLCTCQEAGLATWFKARHSMKVVGTCGDDNILDFFTNVATHCSSQST